MDELEMIQIADDHPIRLSDRYGPGARLLRRWSINGEGYPVCAQDALDTAAATAEQIAEAEAENAAVRVALAVPEPEAHEPRPSARILTVLEFRDRLLAEEELAITAAGMASPAVRVWLDRLSGAQQVDLDDPRTVAGLHSMVAAGLLQPARVATILA